MPEDGSTEFETSDLTLEQLTFLSKWLGEQSMITKGIAKGLRKKLKPAKIVKAHDEAVKKDYLAYNAALTKVKSSISAFKVDWPEAIIVSDDTKQNLQALESKVFDIDSKVENADANKPQFTWGTEQLQIVSKNLNVMVIYAIQVYADENADLEAKRSNLITKINASKKQLSDYRNLEDQKNLSRPLVSQSLDDQGDETKRSNAVEALDLCHKAYGNTLTDLMEKAQAASTKKEIANCEESLKQALVTCQEARNPHVSTLNELVDSLRLSTVTELTELRETNDIAKRECERLLVVKQSKDSLEAGLTALDSQLETLKAKQKDAEGFKEKTKIGSEIKAVKTQKKKIEAIQSQLNAFENSTADRLAAIQEGQALLEEKSKLALDLATASEGDFDKALENWNSGPSQQIMRKQTQKDAENEISPAMKSTILKNIAAAEELFKTAAKTVRSEAKLLLIEDDVTEISDDQCKTLLNILAGAKRLANNNQLDDAEALRAEAVSLRLKFESARSFPLPPVPDPTAEPTDALDEKIKAVTVQLDKVWGQGANVDKLREKLEKVKGDRNKYDVDSDINLEQIDADLTQLQTEILEIDIPATDQEEDEAAKALAKDQANEMAKKILEVFKTKKLDESKLKEIPPDHVIAVNNNGTIEYHQIQMKEDDSSNKFVDEHGKKFKHVPLEAMTKLRESMQTLEMMSQIDVPGSASLVEQAVKDAQELVEQVTDDKAYEDAKKAIDEVQKFLDTNKVKSIFADWRPDNYGTKVQGFENLKAHWVDMVPADAKSKAETFKTDFESLYQKAQELKSLHDDATKFLDTIEVDLSAKNKGDEANIGALIAKLTKLDPTKLVEQVTKNAKNLQDEDIADSVEKIKKSITYLKSVDKKFAGDHGENRVELHKLRQELETRSLSSVQSVNQRAKDLKKKMAAQLNNLKTLIAVKDTYPLNFLKGVGDFLGTVAEGTKSAEENTKAVEAQRKSAETAMKTMKDWLGVKSNESKPNFVEFKSIAQGLETRHDAIKKSLDLSNDLKRALEEYEESEKNWVDLYADATAETDEPKVTAFDFQKASGRIANAVASVGSAATEVKSAIGKKLADDEERKDQKSSQDAVKAVQDVLDLCSADNVTSGMAFEGALAKTLSRVLPENSVLSDKERKDLLAKLREDSLKDLRRMRSRLDSDPALEIYRNNPIDRGQSWVRLSGTILKLENEILTQLKP